MLKIRKINIHDWVGLKQMINNRLIETIFSDFQNSDKYALISEHKEEITYRQLFRLVTDVSVYLKGERLALLIMNNDVGAVVFYLACLKAGTIPIILDKKVTETEVEQYIKTYEPNFILLPLDSEMEVATDRSSDYVKTITIYRHVLYENTGAAEKETFPLLAILLPTSGTTHVSRLVRISKENIYDNAKNICNSLQISEEDVAITSIPLSYTYGLSVLHTHLLKHATILLTDKSVLQKKFWDFSNQYRATSFAGVPYTYELLEKNGHINKENTIKTYTQAGGRLPVRLQKLFMEYCLRTGKKFYVMYGQTEATARISILQMEYAGEKLGSVGQPIDGGKVFIETQDSVQNEGEIIYAGKNVCLGYCSCLEELKREDENGGVLHTGDIGYLDKDGFLYITGRKSDFIKKYGRRICLSDIAVMIEEQYGIQAVVRYEESVFIITCENKHKEKVKQLEETLYLQLHLSKSDFLFRVVKQFERTYNGKIRMGGTNDKYL